MKKRLCIAIVVMGLSGLVAEILLLRELLIVFSGNELCIGIILANWLLLEAFGCFFFGRYAEQSKHPLETFTVLTLLFSFAFLCAIFLTRILKSLVGVSIGEHLGLFPMLYASFLILLPVSLLHGVLFPFSCRIDAMFSGQKTASAGRVYVYETMGTLLGGIVCTYLFIPYLHTFQAAAWLALLNVIICLVLLAPSWKTGGMFQKPRVSNEVSPRVFPIRRGHTPGDLSDNRGVSETWKTGRLQQTFQKPRVSNEVSPRVFPIRRGHTPGDLSDNRGVSETRKTGLFQKILLVIVSVLIVFFGYVIVAGQADKLHQYSINTQWKHLNLVHYQNSQYGNICVVENEGQYIFFQDGIATLITPMPDIPFIEEFVFLPLLAHPQPKKLLILSGGAGGIIQAALKHPSIETIDYAELDPLILDLLRKFPTSLTESELKNRRVTIQQIDGRLFLNTTRNRYDVIFLGILEPSNLQTNRFFTHEFFALVKNRLNPGGILVLGLPGSLTYVNAELKNLNSCIFFTLNSVFASIRVIPGDGNNLFLASDARDITTLDRQQMIARLRQRNIQADVMIPWQLEKKLHPGWQDWFARFLEGSSQQINSDFKPVGLFYSIAHWNALYAPSLRGLFRHIERINVRGIVLVFIVFLLLYVLVVRRGFFVGQHPPAPLKGGLSGSGAHPRMFGAPRSTSPLEGGRGVLSDERPPPDRNGRFQAGIPFAIITTGFAGMIFDLMFIFTFQSLYGYVFAWIGLLVAAFMAGAACGAMFITRALTRITNCFTLFVRIDLAIICFAFGWPALFFAVHAYLGNPGGFLFFRLFFLVMACLCGLLIGAQFPLANAIYLRNSSSVSKTAGLLYASDLLGGWFGGIAGAVVLLPVLGLTGTCFTVGLLKLTSFIVLTTQPNRHL